MILKPPPSIRISVLSRATNPKARKPIGPLKRDDSFPCVIANKVIEKKV